MGKFEFDGEWYDSTIMLEIFAKELDNPKYSFRRSELADAEYSLQIFDHGSWNCRCFKAQDSIKYKINTLQSNI